MSVRLLLDENFPAPSVAYLRAAGYDIIAAAETYSGMDDLGILSRAASEGRWLVTFDRDFGELVFARGLPPPPAVIFLRAPSYRPTDPAEWLLSLLQEPSALLGMFTVLDGGSVRRRPFPHPATGGTG